MDNDQYKYHILVLERIADALEKLVLFQTSPVVYSNAKIKIYDEDGIAEENGSDTARYTARLSPKDRRTKQRRMDGGCRRAYGIACDHPDRRHKRADGAPGRRVGNYDRREGGNPDRRGVTP